MSMMSDIDSRFENSMLSFMELKHDSLHKEIERNHKKNHEYQEKNKELRETNSK